MVLTVVPEPGTMIAGALLLLPFALRIPFGPSTINFQPSTINGLLTTDSNKSRK